jgi:hypothetical protein
MITTNAFMKRDWGKKLIEEFFPLIDLTHVIDTSGAGIPGHGTLTVILFGRHRSPAGHEVRAVLGIRGEPSTPVDPIQGLVWRSIIEFLDQSGAQNDFVGVTDVPRRTFARHPWSVGGGGAAELKELLDSNCRKSLKDFITSIGFASFPGLDDAFIMDLKALVRKRVDGRLVRAFIYGEIVRDWMLLPELSALVPYKEDFTLVSYTANSAWARHLWLMRNSLEKIISFGGKTRKELGDQWWGWYRWVPEKYRSPLSITFAFVATHNHFVLDRGGKVFNRSAPVIKLPHSTTEDDHLALLGLLNSSTACFWMKQIFHNKGSTVDDRGARQTTVAFENFYEFTGTGLQKFPVTQEKPLDLAGELDHLAQERQKHLPAHLSESFPLSRTALDEHRREAAELLRTMISLQEELDWRCYTLYGITDEDLCYRDHEGKQGDPPGIGLDQRAFEIVMARQMAAGQLETTWFKRHRSKPITEIPSHWPDEYKRLVERRIAAIERNHDIALIERPEYKRRWNTEPWEEQEQRALRNWLLDRLEDERYWPELSLQTTRTLANKAHSDADFLQVAELYRGHAGLDVHALVAELVASEAVPFLPVLRYKASGLRKRDIWERTWVQQRREDAIDADVAASLHQQVDESATEFQERLQAEQRQRKQEEVGDIPAPPKYTSADVQSSTYWRLRGPLDVPKERFVSYPFCSPDADSTLVVAWAGWDHLQQARALAAWYTELVEREGWPPERLQPLLAGLAELIPWLKQWHNDIDPEFNQRMGDFFEGFLQGQLQQYGLTRDDLKAWAPPARGRTHVRR